MSRATSRSSSFTDPNDLELPFLPYDLVLQRKELGEDVEQRDEDVERRQRVNLPLRSRFRVLEVLHPDLSNVFLTGEIDTVHECADVRMARKRAVSLLQPNTGTNGCGSGFPSLIELQDTGQSCRRASYGSCMRRGRCGSRLDGRRSGSRRWRYGWGSGTTSIQPPVLDSPACPHGKSPRAQRRVDIDLVARQLPGEKRAAPAEALHQHPSSARGG